MVLNVRGSACRRFFAFLLLAVSVLCTPLGHARQAAPQEIGEVIGLSALPSQGQATYALIKQGGPFPFDKDGVVFGNRERILPLQKRGYYREYTVKTVGAGNRGAKRIVCGGPARTPDACFYTSDHYASFRRIVE
jgi:ribonuclease T1